MEMTDNELIAEFMGWTIEGEPEFKAPYEIWISETGARMYPRTDPQGNKYPEKFKFHESWDWLMPVVEKIEILFNKQIDQYNKVLGEVNREADVEYQNVLCLPITIGLDNAYKAVIRFIKWYNSTKETTNTPRRTDKAGPQAEATGEHD